MRIAHAGDGQRRFAPRLAIVAGIFLFFAFLAAAKLIRIVTVHRSEWVALAMKSAAHEGIFQPPRGKIFDADGVLLAWSERFYDLTLTRDGGDDERYAELGNALFELLPRAEIPAAPEPGKTYVVARALSVVELEQLRKLTLDFHELRIKLRVERRLIDNSALRGVIGTVALREGRSTGLDGLEQTYDAELAGRPGRFRVLLDRERHWIPGTWRYLHHPKPGKDIHLALPIAELEKMAGVTPPDDSSQVEDLP